VTDNENEYKNYSAISPQIPSIDIIKEYRENWVSLIMRMNTNPTSQLAYKCHPYDILTEYRETWVSQL